MAADRKPLVVGANGLDQAIQAGDTLVNPSGFPYASTFTPTNPARALNTNYQPSTTRYTMVIASIQTQSTSGQTGTVKLLSDAATPPTVERARVANTVAVLLGISSTTTNVLVYIVPPGHYYRLDSTGTATNTLVVITEITFD